MPTYRLRTAFIFFFFRFIFLILLVGLERLASTLYHEDICGMVFGSDNERLVNVLMESSNNNLES